MRCLYCGSYPGDGSQYCRACAVRRTVLCTSCGQINFQETDSCSECHALLPVSADATVTSEAVLAALSNAGGERKRLTVLFADIRNSTMLIENLDPEIGMRRLQPALERMKAAVERYGGVVNRTQGDGIMALFGAPNPHEDHAVRACMAASLMRDAVARLGDPQLTIRVGIHTGEVVVQAMNNTLYQTLDAAGVNVHLASRLEQLAEDGRILLSAETFAAAKEFVRCRPLGPQQMRGARQVDVFELVGARHAAASELFRTRPNLSPLIGRASTINALEDNLASAVLGDGRVLGMAGDAGIGKSRLGFEFAENCRKKGVRVHEVRVLAHGRATPLQPVLALLREWCGVKEGEPGDDARQQIAASLREISVDEETTILVLDLLGLASAGQPSPKLDPVVRKMRLIELIRRIPSFGDRSGATVIMIEDLHWIDTASNEVLEALIEAVTQTRTLLLLTFRTGLAAPWMTQPHYVQLDLAPLQERDTECLLDNLLGSDGTISTIRQSIMERARGNPFFVEELVNSLVETGTVKGQPGAYRLARSLADNTLPSTIEAVLAARVDRVHEPNKQVLQLASVIGREFPLAILEHANEMQPADLAEALSALCSADLLHELSSRAPRQYAFRHPLIQEAVYRSLLRERRSRLHGAVARAIEAQYKDRPGEWAGLLAYHLERAGDLLKAAQASMRAAIWIGVNDAKEAFRNWKKVLELLAGEASSKLTDNLRMMACGQIMNFGWREGMLAEEAERYFEEANNLAIALGNMRASALIHAAYGRILAASGSADKYVWKIQQAATLTRDSNDVSLQVTLKAVLCHALRLAGRMHEALATNTEALGDVGKVDALDRKLLGFDVERWLTVLRGQILVAAGRFDEARTHLERSLQHGSARNDLTHHLASVAYVEMAWAEGNADLAEHHASRAFAIAAKSGSPYVRVYALASQGLASIVAGTLDAALAYLREALGFARSCKVGLELEARILADLANAYYLNNDFEKAWLTTNDALDVALLRNARLPECLAHIVRAQVILASRADLGGAEHEVQRARALLQETGAAIYEPLMSDLERKLIEKASSARGFQLLARPP